VGMWWLSWGCGGSVGMWWLSWGFGGSVWGCGGSVVGDVVAQLAKARLGEPDCNAAVLGSISASSTVS
jgi:hypothetical protein